SVENLKVFRTDGSPADEGIEINDLVPVFRTEQHDGHDLPRLGGLNQCQHFKKFVDGAETTGEDDESFRQINKPELTHEEIMEVEDQFRGDIPVHTLFVRQLDIETKASAACEKRAATGRFHHSSRSSGTDDEVMMTGERLRPFRQSPREFDGVSVVSCELD